MFKTLSQAVWWSWFWRNEARSVQPLGRVRLWDSVFWRRWRRWIISHQRVLSTIGKFWICFRSTKHPCSSLGHSIFTTLKVISVVTVQFVIMEPANSSRLYTVQLTGFLHCPSYLFITYHEGCNNYWIITVLWLFSLSQKFTNNAKLQVLELLYIL